MKNENKLLTSGARYSAYGKAGGALGVVSAELMFFFMLNIVLTLFSLFRIKNAKYARSSWQLGVNGAKNVR